jgi:polyisoprenoid-binding protein YceI
MKLLGWKAATVATLAALGCALFVSASVTPTLEQTAAPVTSEIVLRVDPAQSKVHWTVDSSLHRVHGTFALKGGSVHFDPTSGRAGGEIAVYATSGESGNDSRDARMHREILETAKYPDALFKPTQIEGKVAPNGPSDSNVHGIFSIHGGDHDLIVPVHAEITGDHWKGTTKFEVPYVKWGIKDPSNFLLKVKPVVNVELELSGEIKAPK